MTRYTCIEPFTFYSTDEYSCIFKVEIGEEIDLEIAYDDCIGGTRYFVNIDGRYVGDIFTDRMKYLKQNREDSLDKLL